MSAEPVVVRIRLWRLYFSLLAFCCFGFTTGIVFLDHEPIDWLRFAFLLAFCFPNFTAVLVFLDHPHINWRAFTFSVGDTMVLCLPIAFFAAWIGTFHVSSSNVRGFSAWGTPQTFDWSDVSAIRPLDFLGIKFVRVISKKLRLALWLFVTDVERLEQTRLQVAALGERPRQLSSYFA